MNQDNKVSLNIIKDLEDKIKSVRTRSLDLSFNELVDMYKDNELIITPDYQRLYRWSEANQSRFIESLLLEMPIPPIFVVEKERIKRYAIRILATGGSELAEKCVGIKR